jgi:hypothetical protein
MKKISKLICLLALTSLLLCESSCSNWCTPKNIESGRSAQHHDAKKFRVIKSHPIGDGKWYVHCIRYNDERKFICECKPVIENDSITIID